MIWNEDMLPRQPLEEVLEPEMVKQYRIRRGKQCTYMPVFAGEQWLCSCGTENKAGENCQACGLSPEPLTRQVLDQLRQDAAARLEEEEQNREQREEAELRAAMAAKRRKRWRKVAIWAACVAGVLALAAGVWAFLRFGLPAVHYHRAVAALEKQDYPQAHRLFVLSKGYKDADAYLSRFYTPVQTVTGTITYTDLAREEDDLLPEKSKTSYVYTFDSFGRLLTVKEEALQSDWQEPEKISYTNVYDEKGNRLVHEDSFGKMVRQYDDHGSVRMEDYYLPDGTHDYSKIFVIAYDELGRMVESTEVCSDHVLVNYSYEQHLTYAYDERGNLIKVTNETNFPATSESNYNITILWTYNDRNDPVRMESDMVCPDDPGDNCLEINTWEYDNGGKLLRHELLMEYPNNALATYRTVRTCTYDGSGNLLSDITKGSYPNDPDRDYEQILVCTYDKEGRLTKQSESLQYVGKDRNLFAGFSSEETYTYDSLGRVKEKVLVKDYIDSEHSYTQSYAHSYGLDGTLRKTKEVYCGRGEEAEEDHETITQYNENGLPQRVEKVSKSASDTQEYTYGYYYYPEGVEMPQNDT